MAARALCSVTVKPRFSATSSLYLCPLFSSSRSFLRLPAAAPSYRFPPLHKVRPLLALVPPRRDSRCFGADGLRCFSSSRTTSSLNDPSPNWSNRPPKETILLDGCDFEHWLCVVDPPDPNLTRDEIIKSYIQTLAKVVGSEEEARMKIYSVSTKHYFAFGALVSEELSYKIKELPGVRWVLPDSYLDVKNKDYGGEPFINGEAVPYDPKYHEEWVRNNARANERNRRNDRPRNFDRSRNFERRRENMQNFQNRGAPAPPPPPPSPVQSQQFANQGGTNPVPPNMGSPPPSGGYQQQSTVQNPVPSGGSNLNMGGFPNQGTNVGLPNPNFRGNQHQMPNDFGGYQTQVPSGAHGSNFGDYQGQVPSGAPKASYSAYQNQGPNPQNYGGGAYQGSHGGYQGYPSGSQAPNPGGYQGYPSGSQAPNPGGYQGNPSGSQGPNPGGYQGNPSGNQGPNPGGFPGSPPPNFQGNPGPYQGSPNAYQGRGTGYPSSNSYQGSEPDQFQPRDVPGRD